MAFRWCDDDGPTLNAGFVFHGIRTSIAKKPFSFVIYNCPHPCPPSGFQYAMLGVNWIKAIIAGMKTETPKMDVFCLFYIPVNSYGPVKMVS